MVALNAGLGAGIFFSLAFENMVAFLSYRLLFINNHFLYVATDSGFPFYKGYVKGFLVVWILVNCCKKEK